MTKKRARIPGVTAREGFWRLPSPGPSTAGKPPELGAPERPDKSPLPYEERKNRDLSPRERSVLPVKRSKPKGTTE